MLSSGIGTVKWTILDDQGASHDIILDDVLFVPQAPVRLLCPQQWAQQVKLKQPHDTGTYSVNHSDGIILFWNNGMSTKTIPWSKKTNTAYLRTSPSFKNAMKFYNISNPHINVPGSALAYVNEEITDEDINIERSLPRIRFCLSDSLLLATTRIPSKRANTNRVRL